MFKIKCIHCIYFMFTYIYIYIHSPLFKLHVVIAVITTLLFNVTSVDPLQLL